jgi:hypothetical protein
MTRPLKTVENPDGQLTQDDFPVGAEVYFSYKGKLRIGTVVESTETWAKVLCPTIADYPKSYRYDRVRRPQC